MAVSFRQIYLGLHEGQPLAPVLWNLRPLTHWVGRNVQFIILRLSTANTQRTHQASILRACQIILDYATNRLAAADIYSTNFNKRALTIPEKKEWEDFCSNHEFLIKTLQSLREIAVWGSFPLEQRDTIQLYLAMGEGLHSASTRMAKCLKVIQRFKHYHASETQVVPKYLRPLKPFISPFFTTQVDFGLFSLCICREMKDAVDRDLTEQFISGKSISFYAFETKSTKSFSPSPFQIYYRKSPHPVHPTREIFVFFQGRLIGQGGYKKVFLSITTLFKKKFPIPYKITSYQTVLSIIEGSKAIAQVKRGLQNHAAILSQIPADKRQFFALFPTFIGETSPTTLQYVQAWYQGDLLTAAEKGELPENIYGTQVRRLKLKDFLFILLDVCEALKALHRLRLVHRDVKATNILVYYDKGWRGVLADYDLSGKEGYYTDGRNYSYWSTCAQNGIISIESADGYGLIIALGEVFFLNHIQKFIDNRKLILTDEYNQLLVIFLKRHTLIFLSRMAPAQTSKDIDSVRDLVSKLPDTTRGDTQLYNYLSQIMQNEKTKIYHQSIKKLLVELNMYKMIHSFIKTCVELDAKIYQSALSDPHLKTLASNELKASAFSSKIRQQLRKEKGGNIFSVDVIQEKIKIMYRTLESGDAGKIDPTYT
jgi:serine/threonine protein kinase